MVRDDKKLIDAMQDAGRQERKTGVYGGPAGGVAWCRGASCPACKAVQEYEYG